MISGFRHNENEICTLLRYCAEDRSFGTSNQFLEDGTYTLFRNFSTELPLYVT